MVIKFPTSIAYTLIPNILYIIFRHLFRIFFNLNFFFCVDPGNPAVAKCNWWLIIFMMVTLPYPHPTPFTPFIYTPNLVTTKIQITRAMSIVFQLFFRDLPGGMWLKLGLLLVGGSTTTWGTWSPANPGASWKTHRCWSPNIHNCMMAWNLTGT